MRYRIQCEECDSEYEIEYEEGLISDDIQFCSVCKEKVDPELQEEDE